MRFLAPTGSFADAITCGVTDTVWDIPILQSTILRLQSDATFRKHHMECNKVFKSGKLHHVHADVITDPLSADVARDHEELYKKATPDEEKDLRIPLSFYNDAFDVSTSKRVAASHAPPHTAINHAQ